MKKKHQFGEIDSDTKEFLTDIKAALHELNRSFYQGKKIIIALENLSYIFIQTYHFREEFYNDELKVQSSLDRVIGQTAKMQQVFENEKEASVLVKEYLVLRKFIERLEKEIIRFHYYDDTGKVASKIGGISWASKVSGKSEVTIRRYIFSKKILAYKATKKWWIPLEELNSIRKLKGG